ncbi:MAG: helix-turn-helix transcriptional regulator, partial [Hyphomonadaceae bacterium]|nr:helix-turn-helix transcriptional regulator [Hyphomonadaceae bacterium]
AEVRASAFSSAALGLKGALIVTDARLEHWTLQTSKLKALLEKARLSTRASVGIIDDPDGLPVAVALAQWPTASKWPLQDAVRQALQDQRAKFALIAFNPRDKDWLIAARAYGLTPAETRLISSLARTRDLRAACDDLGIGYETGRKAVGAVMTKTGTTRQPELLREAMMVTAGGIPTSQEAERMFADVFGLKLRQAQIARQISLGLTRKQVARHLELSLSSVKDDLSDIYLVTGVNSALSLSRVFQKWKRSMVWRWLVM